MVFYYIRGRISVFTGVGGLNLSRVIAQDHAPGLAREMSKLSKFRETGKIAFKVALRRFSFLKLVQWEERKKISDRRS